MSEKNYYKGTSTTYEDGNINYDNVVDIGDAVLIIGTATRGPVNKPIKITNGLSQAIEIFGPIDNTGKSESLITAFNEVYNGPRGKKDIRLCRISNGKKATLSIAETSGSGLKGATSDKYALTLTALYPGEIYNSISISKEIVNGKSCIVIYNPITKIESVFPYNLVNSTSTDIKTIDELVYKINSDSNLNNILIANTEKFTAYCDLTLSQAEVDSGFVEQSNGMVKINLAKMFTDASIADSGNNNYIGNNNIVSPSGLAVTSANQIAEVYDTYRYVTLTKTLDSDGVKMVQLDSPVEIDFSSGTSKPIYNASGIESGDGQAVQVVDKVSIAVSDGIVVDYYFAAKEKIKENTLVVYKQTITGQIVELTKNVDWVVDSLGGSTSSYQAQIHFLSGKVPKENESILVSYESEPYNLTKCNSLDAVNAAGVADPITGYKYYFFAGDRIYFGIENTTDIKIIYPSIVTYTAKADIFVYSSVDGIIQINDTFDFSDGKTVKINLNWRYLPEWVNVNTTTYSLSGGTNGSIFSNAVKYKLLEELFETISDYRFKYVTIAKTYIDDTKKEYSEIDGLPIEVNAGFAKLLSDFVAGMSFGVGEPIGIMDVKPVENGDVETWYNRLVTVSNIDTTRAANVMANRDYKNLVVCVGNILASDTVKSQYFVSLANIMAGMLAKRAVNETISFKQLESSMSLLEVYPVLSDNINTLTAMGYTVVKKDNDDKIKWTETVTASKADSDYKKLSSYRIASACADLVRSIEGDFLGDLFDNTQLTTLNTAMQSKIQKLKEMTPSPIRYFVYNLTQTASQRANGEAYVEMEIGPNFELCKIIQKVKLTNKEDTL